MNSYPHLIEGLWRRLGSHARHPHMEYRVWLIRNLTEALSHAHQL